METGLAAIGMEGERGRGERKEEGDEEAAALEEGADGRRASLGNRLLNRRAAEVGRGREEG